MDDAAREVFAAKVDAFAASLDPDEQVMLAELLGDEAEVSGFDVGWPGLGSLGVWKAPAGTEAVRVAPEPEDPGFASWGMSTGT